LTKDFQKNIATFKERKTIYEDDGLVLTPMDGLYNTMKVYKYKPIEKLTCDFIIKQCPKELIGKGPYKNIKGKTLYLLFCGINKSVKNNLNLDFIPMYSKMFPDIDVHNPPAYMPIQFMPSNKPVSYLYWKSDKDVSAGRKIDGSVGEFRVGNYKDPLEKFEWELIRIRSDRDVDVATGRYFGNNYMVIELNWMSYLDPLVIEDLDTSVYFKTSDNPIHKISRQFNSSIKSIIFESFSPNSKIVDLASGKGQDLFRYGNNKVEQVLFVEYDMTALLELISRKHSFAKKANHPMSILIQQADLNSPCKGITDQLIKTKNITKQSFDIVICNFAIHYLVANTKSITNISNIVRWFVKDGRFIFTAFDGQAVFDLLDKNKGVWKSKTDKKYEIRKKYKEKKFKNYGQQIDVLLPFSSGGFYTEYLVNISYIQQIFCVNNMTLVRNESFSTYFDNKKNKLQNKLDDDDKTYISLYHVYEFQIN